jgi:hypothetical protein
MSFYEKIENYKFSIIQERRYKKKSKKTQNIIMNWGGRGGLWSS